MLPVRVRALYQPFPMLRGRRAQIWRHQPEYRRPRHFHEEPELNVVVHGTCELGVGERVHRLSAGHLVLLQPGQDHVLLQASEDLELFVLALSPAVAERAFGGRTLASSDGGVLVAPETDFSRSDLAALCRVNDGVASETELAERFARALRGGSSTHVVSRRALEVVRREPGLSCAALARCLSTTPSSLSRWFRGALSVPLVEYRARVRLMRFVSLVDEGRSLTRAAQDADFGSYAQCHRVFSRALGCAPSEYFRGARQRVDAATYCGDQAPARLRRASKLSP